jgi:VWFA-related protein
VLSSLEMGFSNNSVHVSFAVVLLLMFADILPLAQSNRMTGSPAQKSGNITPANIRQNGKTDLDHGRQKFGDSLKRLKWDAAKGMAVERKGPKNSATTEDPGSIKLSTTLVTLDVLVTDNSGTNIIGLGKDDFVVSQDDRPQQAAVFSAGDDHNIPRKLILLIDWSGSERSYLDSSIHAASMLVNKLAVADKMAIVTSDVQLIAGFTSEKAKLLAALDALQSRAARRKPITEYPHSSTDYKGRSLQFTALLAAVREVIDPKEPRQIVIFQTDGDEAPTFRDQPQAGDFIWNMPDRQYGLADIYSAAEHCPATIYTVIPSENLIGLSGPMLLDRGRRMLEEMERARFTFETDYLRYSQTHPMTDAKVKLFTESFSSGQSAAAHVAEITGGWCAFLHKAEDAQAIYSRILSDINGRYTIGYYPQELEHDGKLHHLKIEVRGHPEYVIHGRDSYYAPNSDQE